MKIILDKPEILIEKHEDDDTLYYTFDYNIQNECFSKLIYYLVDHYKIHPLIFYANTNYAITNWYSFGSLRNIFSDYNKLFEQYYNCIGQIKVLNISYSQFMTAMYLAENNRTVTKENIENIIIMEKACL